MIMAKVIIKIFTDKKHYTFSNYIAGETVATFSESFIQKLSETKDLFCIVQGHRTVYFLKDKIQSIEINTL